MRSFSSRFLVPAAAALALAAGVLGGEQRASAQVVEVAPPAIRLVSPAPRVYPRRSWYYAERPGQVWVHTHWVRDGWRWREVPGHWRHW